jgi:hypothetical protein
MTTTTKVLIGLSIAATAGAVYYFGFYRKGKKGNEKKAYTMDDYMKAIDEAKTLSKSRTELDAGRITRIQDMLERWKTLPVKANLLIARANASDKKFSEIILYDAIASTKPSVASTGSTGQGTTPTGGGTTGFNSEQYDMIP